MVQITYPSDLPVSQKREDILTALREHQVIIVAGETGSGKTTQLPKMALELGARRIAHTQPRRIAARAVAERIADELGSELGDLVGYQVRFTDRVSDHTRVRVMTDGILLNHIHRDRDLRDYDVIIIDEAHERSLNIDFLLGWLRRLLPKRPDLKVIITSATIDPETFAKHFAGSDGTPAPIIEVSGRTYPVEVRYRPLTEGVPDAKDASEEEVERPIDLFEGLDRAVTEILAEGPGDVLVFLSGESEIRDAQDMLEGKLRSRREAIEILPLYGRLSAHEQHRVFAQRLGRRIILATNVAETSLTVPGIVYVIDAGTARISRWNPRSKVQHLPIEPISQASAGQRAGRAGRTQPGVVIRLYAEDDFLSRPEFTDPEIVRTGLSSVILQMMSLGLGDIARFPFVTPPDKRGIADGLTLLSELGAVHQGKITRVGRSLARLPLEPRFARMIIEAQHYGVTQEVIALVAGLTIQDVRERPEAERAHADQLHARFQDPEGDLMTLLNLWRYLQEQHQARSSSAFRRLCRAEFLNYLRVREWMDLVRQLQRATKSLPEPKQTKVAASTSEAIHRSALSGLLSRLGVRDDTQRRDVRGSRRKLAQEYLGSRGTRFVLFPGSVLAKRPPECVMSVELVETSRLFARGNAVVNPEWAEELAGPLVKRQVSDPHWEKSQGAAVAFERVTLFGVPLVERRRIQYARIDPEHARELFIRHALVEGDWDSPQSFDRANWQLRRELEQLEERSRRRDIVADEDAIFDFYDERIPQDVVSTRSFEGWWKQTQRKTPKLLHLNRNDLITGDTASDAEFPRVWQYGDQRLKLSYRFDPTAEDDGVTINVPLPLLPRLEQEDFAKLVPGFREELVAGLIRALPKPIRKHVVPANDWAKRLLAEIEGALDDGGSASLTTLLAHAIRRHTSQTVTEADFDLAKLPNHLTPTFSVIDERGKRLGKGRDVNELKQRFRDRTRGTVAKAVARAQSGNPAQSIERTGITRWDFGDLPPHIDSAYDARGHAGVVRAYPAIVDRGKHVDLVLVADQAEQERLTHAGVRRLVLLSTPHPGSYIRDHLTNNEKILLGGGPYRSLDDAISDVGLATVDAILAKHSTHGPIRTEGAFQRIADEYARTLIDEIYRGISLTAQVLDAARLARKAIDTATSLHTLSQVKDASAQLDALVYRGFVSSTGLQQLERVPVYLRALTHRMQHLTDNLGRDRTWQNEVDRVLEAYTKAGGTIPDSPDAPQHLQQTRWLIEEFRVSLFAQQFGARGPVSAKRILQMLQSSSATH